MSDKYEGLRQAAERAQKMLDDIGTPAHNWEGSTWNEFTLKAGPDVILSLLQERDQLSAKESPVEPPQWEDYFRALKLSYPENLTAIYVAKEVYSMFMSAPLRESPEFDESVAEEIWERHCELMEVIECDSINNLNVMRQKDFYKAVADVLRRMLPYSAPKGESE